MTSPAGDPAREHRYGADRGDARNRALLAAITAAALSQYGIVFAVPVGTLAVFVVVAILAGMLAGTAGLAPERAGGAAVE